MDSTDLNPDNLLSGQDVNSLVNQSLQPFAAFFMIFTIFSIALTIAIVVFWILSMVRRRKVQAAILDIQATLHEMNERDKARSAPPSPVPGKLVAAEVPADTQA